MKCPICKNNEGVSDKTYGQLPCANCQQNSTKIKPPVEFTTESIREQRREYKDLIIQPYRGGVLSKEFVDKYGTKGLADKDVKNAQSVWGDLDYYGKK